MEAAKANCRFTKVGQQARVLKQPEKTESCKGCQDNHSYHHTVECLRRSGQPAVTSVDTSRGSGEPALLLSTQRLTGRTERPKGWETQAK